MATDYITDADCDTTGYDSEDEYGDTSYCRGWDASANMQGNRAAKYHPPVPGRHRDFQKGWDAAEKAGGK